MGSFTESYGYDALNRLTSSYGPGLPSKVYQCNAIGNLTFKTSGGGHVMTWTSFNWFSDPAPSPTVAKRGARPSCSALA